MAAEASRATSLRDRKTVSAEPSGNSLNELAAMALRKDAAIGLMLEGLTDLAIHRSTGTTRTTLRKWRRAAGISPCRDFRKPLAYGPQRPHYLQLRVLSKEPEMRRLFELGKSQKEIIRLTGCARQTVAKFRKREGFQTQEARNWSRPPRYQSRLPRKIIRPDRDPLYARIKKAVSYNPSYSVMHDAISDMYVAVLSGDIRADEIEAKARRFTSKVVEQYSSKWGDASLDERIGDDDECCRYDFIADENTDFALDVALYRGLFGEIPMTISAISLEAKGA